MDKSAALGDQAGHDVADDAEERAWPAATSEPVRNSDPITVF